MKIFIAVHHYPPRFTGGAELRTHRTAKALQQRGHTVQAFAIERINEGPAGRIAWEDEIFEGVPIRRVWFNGENRPDWFTYSYNNPWIEDHLNQFLSEFKPDIFHLFGGYLQSGSSIRAAVDLAIPTVLSLTDYWFLCPRIQLIRRDNTLCTDFKDPVYCLQCVAEDKRRYRWAGHIFPGLMRAYWKLHKNKAAQFLQRKEYLMTTLNLIDRIIAPSKFISEIHIDSGVKREKVIFHRQGRTFQNLTPEMLNKKPSPTLRLGYIGQLIDIKGVHVILEALHLLPADAQLSLDIYGDLGKNIKYVKKLRQIAGKDQRVRFMGLFGHDQISEVFRELDIVIVPSLWYENSPNVILEAFAHKTPVIASNLGAMPELVIDEKCGLLFKAGDPKSLADVFKRLLEDDTLLAKLAARIMPPKTEKQEIDELEHIYQSIVDSRPNSN